MTDALGYVVWYSIPADGNINLSSWRRDLQYRDIFLNLPRRQSIKSVFKKLTGTIQVGSYSTVHRQGSLVSSVHDEEIAGNIRLVGDELEFDLEDELFQGQFTNFLDSQRDIIDATILRQFFPKAFLNEFRGLYLNQGMYFIPDEFTGKLEDFIQATLDNSNGIDMSYLIIGSEQSINDSTINTVFYTVTKSEVEDLLREIEEFRDSNKQRISALQGFLSRINETEERIKIYSKQESSLEEYLSELMNIEMVTWVKDVLN